MSGLPGRRHDLPEGAVCDQHPERPAVANIQGETDSFGYETILMCQECLDADRAYEASEEAHSGRCDWCKSEATDLRWARDYDEGMSGPVYRVCAACRRRVNEEAERELAAHDDGYWDYEDEYLEDYDPAEDCGRWQNGKLGPWSGCRMAGTEFCDWECPYSNPPASVGQSPKGEKPKALSAEHADAATPKAADAQPSLSGEGSAR